MTTLSPKANSAYVAQVTARRAALAKALESVLPSGTSTFIWEIGSGHGHFLVKHASLNPGQFHLGIDLLSDRLRKAERRRLAAQVPNLCFVKAEAEEFLSCLPLGVAVSAAVILFPDPWPKKRHHKNRLIQFPFLSALALRMAARGRLYFRTDHKPYLEWARETVSAHPAWTVVADAPWLFEEQTVFQKRAPAFGSLVAELRTPSPTETPPG